MAMKKMVWKRDDGVVIERIDMGRARKLFTTKKPFYIGMENLRPDFAIEIAGEDFAEENFDRIVNAYLYYNRGRELGYRCRFYVRM